MFDLKALDERIKKTAMVSRFLYFDKYRGAKKKSPRKAVGGELYLSLTKQNYREYVVFAELVFC